MNCDKNQFVTKLKLWQNTNCDKSLVVTKVKLWQKSNCDKNKIMNKKLKKAQCDKTQIVTELENSNSDKTQKLKLWQNLKYGKS